MSGPKQRRRWRIPWTPIVLVPLLLVLTVGLRWIGLHWELPSRYHYFSYHPDEFFLLAPAYQYFAQGDWNPHFFNYGTLYIYLVGIPAVLTGAATRFPFHDLYWLGRLVTALLGMGTVALLYFAVRREGRRLAVASALLLAVLPLHVIDSHYATVDVPATFWLVLAFLFALRGAEKPGWLLAVPTGLAVGLAAATKYNVGLFLVPALLAPLVPPAKAGLRRWAPGVVLGCIAGFFAGVPYAAGPEFPAGFLFELQHARQGGTTAFEHTGPGWIYHLVHGFPIALGFPLLLALILGIVVTVRTTTSRAARLSLFWCALYLLMIGFSRERFIRYLVPMTPFLAVIAAHGLIWLWRMPRPRSLRMAAAGAGLAVVLLTSLYTGGLVTAFVHDDPRERAWGKAGPVLVSMNPEGNLRVGMVQPPWFFSPPASPLNGGPVTKDAFARWDAEHGWRIIITGWEVSRLEAARPWAFYLSDLESRDLLRLKDPKAVAFTSALDKMYRYHLVIANPAPPFSWLAPGRTWAPPDWLYLWPQITLYTNYQLARDEPRF